MKTYTVIGKHCVSDVTFAVQQDADSAWAAISIVARLKASGEVDAEILGAMEAQGDWTPASDESGCSSHVADIADIS